MNNKTVALEDKTLSVGEQVVLNPRQHMQLFDFSEFPEVKAVEASQTATSDAADSRKKNRKS